MTELAKALSKVATQMQDWLPSVQTKDMRGSGYADKGLMLFEALEELVHACENQPGSPKHEGIESVHQSSAPGFKCTQPVRLRTWRELSDRERQEFLDCRYSGAWAEQVYANAIKLARTRQPRRYA